MKARGLDFRRGRIVKGHGLYIPLPLAERVRAARGIPQAIVKIIGFGKGRQGARGILRYASRKGDLPLETETADQIKGMDQQKSLAKDWARSFDRRVRSRDVVHLAFSMPRGSDPEKLRAAVRTVVTGHFAGHQAAFAIHTDRPHPHAHLALTMKSQRDGKKLRLRRADIHRLREAFAEAAREQGVELAASSRAARGVGRKADKRVVYVLRQKGIVPRSEQHAAQDAARELQGAPNKVRPWEAAILRRHQTERQTYRVEANRVRAAIPKQPPQVQATLLKSALDLERFARTMPLPKTMRQLLSDKLKAAIRSKRRGLSAPPQPPKGLER